MSEWQGENSVAQVILAARESSIGAVLFHQAAGQILGLNATDMKCLDIIALTGSASPSRLAQLTGLTTGAVTAMLDRLERAKLVRRQPDRSDRRSKVVVLTREAGRRLPPLFESLAKALEALVLEYPERDRELLRDFFQNFATLWTQEREKIQALHRPRSRRK